MKSSDEVPTPADRPSWLRYLRDHDPERLRLLRETAVIRNDPARPGDPEQHARVDALSEATVEAFMDWVETRPLPEQVQAMRLLRPAGKLDALIWEWQPRRFRAWAEAIKEIFRAADKELPAQIDEILTEGS